MEVAHDRDRKLLAAGAGAGLVAPDHKQLGFDKTAVKDGEPKQAQNAAEEDIPAPERDLRPAAAEIPEIQGITAKDKRGGRIEDHGRQSSGHGLFFWPEYLDSTQIGCIGQDERRKRARDRLGDDQA